MDIDYRCYIKFRNSAVWRSMMQKIVMEDLAGEEYSFLEISEIFTDPKHMVRMITEPIGEIFDTLNANEEMAFAFIHDRGNSPEYFEGLAKFIIGVIVEEAKDDAIVIADYTDINNDSFGDYVLCYFGGGESGISKFHFGGPEGLERHDIEINSFEEFLGEEYNKLPANQKSMLKDFECNITNLMDHMQFMDMSGDWLDED